MSFVRIKKRNMSDINFHLTQTNIILGLTLKKKRFTKLFNFCPLKITLLYKLMYTNVM